MRIPKAEDKLTRVRAIRSPYEMQAGGLNLTVLPDVYPTGELAELVVDALDDPSIASGNGATALDYGTGTGFLAIVAATRGMRVVATDINPAACECARLNAERHAVEVEVRLGAGFNPIREGELFDVIFASMPWDDAPAKDMLERSMYDPEFEMRRALFASAKSHLTTRGCILLTYSESAEQRNPMMQFADGYRLERILERPIKGEPHYILRASIAQ